MVKGSGSYPLEMAIKKNFKITIRPAVIADIPSLRIMFEELDDLDLSLLYANLLDPYFEQRIKRWMEDEAMYILVAFHDDLAVGTIIMERGRLAWTQHTAQLMIATHPDYRRYGVATVLTEEVIPFAEKYGVEKLYARILPQQRAAISMAKRAGFQREASLKDHVKDKYDRYHTLRFYSVDLQAAHRAMEDMLSHISPYSG